MGKLINSERPLIHLQGGLFYHDNTPCKVVIKGDIISVACSDIAASALYHLANKLTEYSNKNISKRVDERPEEIIQDNV